MNQIEFKVAVKQINDRWAETSKQWWFDEMWTITKDRPLRAFEIWCARQMRESRQYPLPGEFQRWWWDHEHEFVEKKDEEQQYCDKCKHLGFIWAWKDNYEYCFRCECNNSYKRIPLWEDSMRVQYQQWSGV